MPITAVKWLCYSSTMEPSPLRSRLVIASLNSCWSKYRTVVRFGSRSCRPLHGGPADSGVLGSKPYPRLLSSPNWRFPPRGEASRGYL